MMRIRSGMCWVVMLIATLLLGSCAEKEQPKEVIRPVRYVQIFSTGGTRTRSFSGVAQAGLESKLSFKVPGTIKRVAVKVGDRVNAGDVIAQLDPNDYQLQVQQADAGLANARAQARNAEANYERVRALYEHNNASKTDLDATRAGSESARAGVQSAEKQLELARLQLSYTTLTAPARGAIAQVHVEMNENVNAGKQVVLLTSGTHIEVKVSIPGILISRIREGSTVAVTFDALPDKEHAAKVTEVGVAATGMVTTFPVTVRLDRSSPDIRPGMAAVVAFLFESRDQRERFVVPSVSVAEDRKGRFVYVVEPISGEDGFGVIHRKDVTIGELTSDGLEIFEGLSDGELVVTAGMSRITDGKKVRI